MDTDKPTAGPQPPSQPQPQPPTKQPNLALIIALAGFAMFFTLILAATIVVAAWLVTRDNGPAQPPTRDAFAQAVAQSMQGPNAKQDAALIQAMYAEFEGVLARDISRQLPDGRNASVLSDAGTIRRRLSAFLEAGGDDWRLSEQYPQLNEVLHQRFSEAGLGDNAKEVNLPKLAAACHDTHTALAAVSGIQIESHRGPPAPERVGFGMFSLFGWAVFFFFGFLALLFLAGCAWAGRAIIRAIAGIALLAVLVVPQSDCLAQNAIKIDGREFQFGYDLEKGPPAADALAKTTDRLFGADVQRLVASTDEIKTVFLWRYFDELGISAEAWNQEWLGSCVGFGSARAASNRLAIEIVTLGKWDWAGHVSPDWTYAASRTITNTNDSGQGSTGAWAYEAITKWGLCFQRDYGGGFDLTTYDPDTALVWQKRGVPKELIEYAKPFPVIAAHRVKTIAEAKALLTNGCPLYTCSGVGYGNVKRDSYGFVAASGRWPHCMMIDGYRLPGTGREGFHQTNSWGKSGSGPKWPDDMPEGSWWISPQDFARQLAAGDTWAIGGVTGFQRLSVPLAEALDFGGTVISERETTIKRPKPRQRSSQRQSGEVYATAP